MGKLIPLKEFETVRGQECSNIGLDAVTIKEIMRFNEKQKKEIIKILSNGVKPTSYIGIFKAGKKTIQILPKISDGADDKIIRNLLHMLTYAFHLEIKEAEVASLCQRKADFFEVIIFLFAKNLLELIKNHFHKHYQEKEENQFFIKGQILFSEDSKININGNKIFCRFSDFSEDILLNQVFKYTTWLLLKVTRDQDNYRILNELNFIFADITLKNIKASDFDYLHIDRLNRQYKHLIDLAKLFITNSSVELSHDKLETFSFLFDMNLLFEQFIAGFIVKKRKVLVSDNSKIIIQGIGRVNFLVEYPEHHFRLKPDIIIEDLDKKIIIDTKYKILDPEDQTLGVSQADLYQVLSYSLKFKCPNIVLLYPAHLTKDIRKDYAISIEEKEIKVFIRCIDLRIDLYRQKDMMVESLKKICDLMIK